MHNDYQFTVEWFNVTAANLWPNLIPLIPNRQKFLEIGSYEGRSTVWAIEHMLTDGGSITCIDSFVGGEEHDKDSMPTVQHRFEHNIAVAKTRFPNRTANVLVGMSNQELPKLIQAGEQFDFIYIDGSHIARDVLTDACMAWSMLVPEGVLVFDDYLWGESRDALHRPKLAVDAFINIFAEELFVAHIGHQAVVKKHNESTLKQRQETA